MDRRTLIGALAAGLVGVQLAVSAQQPVKVYRICVLSPNARESPTSKATHDELRNALGELGYVEGRNVIFDARWAEGKTELLAGLAAELAASKPDVIVAMTTQATLAAKQSAGAVPIVMINVTDPVGLGLVASLAHPGGNVTGLTDFGFELSLKSIELARELIPKATRIAVLVSDNPVHPYQLREIQNAAKRFEVTIVAASAMTADALESAITFAKASADVMIVLGGGLQSGNREKICELAKKLKLPTIANVRPYVIAGALASYGQKVLPQYRLAATYVDKILKGARPADLPVEQPIGFERVMNLSTARALGLVIPQSLLLRANEVIQ